MIPFKRHVLAASIFSVTLAACGGGGGQASPQVPIVEAPTPEAQDPSAGISGSGQRSLGLITQFGSIYVNGVEYETDEAQIIKDGQPVTEDDLGIGMVVFVEGDVNDDGITGNATVVIADNEVEGPISAVISAADGASKQITVLGIDIIIERTATVFENTSFDTIAINDVVEVSGFPESGNNLRATRVEKKSDFIAGETSIEIKGTVTALNVSSFMLGEYTVNYSNADISEVDGELADGSTVEVYGTLTDTEITATRIETENDVTRRVSSEDDFEVEGAVTDYVGIDNFLINGIRVDASAAELQPSTLKIQAGLVVEAEGSWDGAILNAKEVKLRRGRVELDATVSAIDLEASTLTLATGVSSVVVTVTTSTLFDDDTKSTQRLNLSDINVGDFLEVEAYEDGDSLIATRIDREDGEESDDNFEIQGSVQSFTPGVDITVLNVTYDVTTASFETDNDRNVDIDTFFALLNAGDIVEIKFSSNAPTTAIKVELEEDERPDGGLEFDDDDDSDEDQESDESDDDANDDSDEGQESDESDDDANDDSDEDQESDESDDDANDDSDEGQESDESDDDSDSDSGDDEPSDG